MASMLNDARAISATAGVERTEASEGLRIARYCELDELPGVVFGAMTVAWIVLSLAKLAL
jgi:hypothetical protein